MHKQKRNLITGFAVFAACMLTVIGITRAANEIEARVSLKFVPDSIMRDTTIEKFDQTGDHYSYTRQTINTGAWETIVVSADVATNGISFFRNSTTNSGQYIQLATTAATNVFAQLQAEQFALIPMHTGDYLAKAFISDTNITTAILETFIIER